jgi:hypothetical protein
VLSLAYRKTWRSSFYLFTAVNVLCTIGGLLSIDKDRKWNAADKDVAGARRVDWLGAFLITAALVLILFVLGEGETALKQWGTGCTFASTFLVAKIDTHTPSLGARHHRFIGRWHITAWSIHLVAMVP